MHDQANQLRQLVKQHVPRRAAAERVGVQRVVSRQTEAFGRRPNVALVTGGKGGVGATTLCANLAVAMTQAGKKTLLIDADPAGGAMSRLCKTAERHTLADVLAGRRTIADVIQPAPGDVQIIPGIFGLERLSDYRASAWEHMFDQLGTLGRRVDTVLFDAGVAPNALTQRIWPLADLVLIVATSDTSSILDAYAAIKSHVGNADFGQSNGQGISGGNQVPTPIHVLANRLSAPETGLSAHNRLSQACHRFLGINLHWAGQLLEDPMVNAAGRAGDVFSVAVPGCDAAKQLGPLAETLSTTITNLGSSKSVAPANVESPLSNLVG